MTKSSSFFENSRNPSIHGGNFVHTENRVTQRRENVFHGPIYGYTHMERPVINHVSVESNVGRSGQRSPSPGKSSLLIVHNELMPTSPTQHPATSEVAEESPGGPPSNSQDGNTSNPPNQTMPATDTRATAINPFIHPLMIPQFNYWPYFHPLIVVNQFTPFPFGPQFYFPYFPYPFQQSMMNIQPMPTFPSVVPHGEIHCPEHQYRQWNFHYEYRDDQRDREWDRQ